MSTGAITDVSTVYDQFVSIWREIDDGRLNALQNNQDLPMLINEKQKGVTPLYLAVKRKQIQMVLLLLANGADPNIQCRGASPLWLACFHGLTEIIHPLLDNGADPDFVCQESSSLHVAAVRGLIEVCEILCGFERRGADVNLTTDRLGTALHVAVSHGHQHVLAALMKYNPDLSITNRFGETIFHVACRLDDTTIAYNLIQSHNKSLNPFQRDIEHGATVAHVVSSLSLFRTLIRTWPDLLHANDAYGRSPTYYISNDSLALFTSLTSKPLQHFGEHLHSAISRYSDIDILCPSRISSLDTASSSPQSPIKVQDIVKPTDTPEISSVEDALLQASIEVPIERIAAHKAMLWARIPYFRQRLVPSEFVAGTETEQISFDLPEVSAIVMRIVIFYIYTDQLKAHSSLMKEVRAAAKLLGLKRLEELAMGKLNMAVEAGPSTFAQEMLHLKKTAAFADVKVHAQSRTLANLNRDYLLHRFMLADQSEFFQTMFVAGMRESQTGMVELAPCVLDSLEAFLHWIYSGEFLATVKTLRHCFLILELANNYMNTSISLPLQTKILSMLIGSDYKDFDLAVTESHRLHAQIVYEQCAVAYAGKSTVKSQCKLTGEDLDTLQRMAAPRVERLVMRSAPKTQATKR